MGKFSTADRAILKVAYWLSTMVGEIGPAKHEAFKTLCFADNAMTPGTKKANSFLEDVITESENLKKLAKFYSKEELLLAFASKVIPECEKIKEDPVASRKAFAVWIGLCMVDGQYTEDDKIYIKTLQQLFIKRVDPENPLPDLLTPTTSLLGMVSPSLMSLYIGGKVVLHNMQRQANSEPITYENVISDELLEEIIEDCRMLSDLKRQIDLTTDGDSKSSLQNSFTYIENNLKDLIKNGLN